jgi:putative membrane protein
MNMMRYGFDNYFSHMGWLGGGIAMFIGLIVIALVIYWLYTMAHNQQTGYSAPMSNSTYSSNAMSILNERYARGEIGDDEYQRKKAELRNS